jgi:hypothetical protein
MDWIEFCDKAMIAPDARRTDREFAERFQRYTGEAITLDEVRVIREAWENRPPVASTPVISLRVPAEWFR